MSFLFGDGGVLGDEIQKNDNKTKEESVKVEDNKPESKKTTTTSTSTSTPNKYTSPIGKPLKKIGGGGVLQYPVDLNTNIQDYFEIQIFKYRPAKVLPGINRTSQGYGGDYSTLSNRRGNRQNQRLEDLQSTIQLPIPNGLRDTNTTDWGQKTMTNTEGQLANTLVDRFMGGTLGKDGADATEKGFIDQMRSIGSDVTNTIGPLVKDTTFRRKTQLGLVAGAAGALGLNIDVDQAITRRYGVINNPNLELLFNGPALREFTFTVRFTPRSTDESARVRMIIRALKQHMSVKKNPRSSTKLGGSNWLLGTPDVFKLRYIKAKTQKDIKGLNKFKTCALKSLSVDYTGEAGRFAAYDVDSQPITTLITLNFSELVPLYDQDYLEFDSDDDVGL